MTAPPRRGRGRRRRREVPDRGLCVLLLPARLEASPDRERVEDLLGAPGTVAVEPAAIGYGATSRLPALMRERIAAGQARRMALPGHARAIVVFAAAQYPLARALLAEHPEAELWYGGGEGGELHEQARGRAALYFGDEPGGSPRERNRLHAVRGKTDHLEVRLTFEQQVQRLSKKRLVVCDHESDGSLRPAHGVSLRGLDEADYIPVFWRGIRRIRGRLGGLLSARAAKGLRCGSCVTGSRVGRTPTSVSCRSDTHGNTVPLKSPTAELLLERPTS